MRSVNYSRGTTSAAAPLWAALFGSASKHSLPRTNVFSRRARWTTFTVPKNDGVSLRSIDAPDDVAKEWGRILDRWLWQQWSPRFEEGFRPTAGTPVVLDALTEYRQRRYHLISIDMSRAFSRVHAAQVYQALRARGIDKGIARLAVRLSCKDGWLVMGAPCSPQLFAMIMEPALTRIEEEFDAEVIAYADDVYVAIEDGSGIPRKWKRRMARILWEEAHQRLNGGKSHLYAPHERLHALGTQMEPTGNIDRLRPTTEARRYAMSRAAAKAAPWISGSSEVDARSALASLTRWKELVCNCVRFGGQYAGEWPGGLDSIRERTRRGSHPACQSLL